MMLEGSFTVGIQAEDIFNRSATISCVRPYESPIFILVQNGDLTRVWSLLTSPQASIHDVDPYGLGLLYYAAYYCWKAYGASTALSMCGQLIIWGANMTWMDDRDNCPMYTMLDCAVASAAMNDDSFDQYCSEIGSHFGMTHTKIRSEYLARRCFKTLYKVLLRIDQSQKLEFLRSSSQSGTLQSMINTEDACYRTLLAWAVEFGWADTARCLLEYRADSGRSIMVARGSSTLLHLALAGPVSQFSKGGFRAVVQLLLDARADVNARDHEGWTPLHIAASWGLCSLPELYNHPGLDWHIRTYQKESVEDLSPLEPFPYLKNISHFSKVDQG
ncbi:hypothetical protein RU639_002338 [Aspergillus parasiticus]